MSAKRIEKSLCILVSFCMILSTVYSGTACAKNGAKSDTELAAEEFATRCDQAGLPLNVSQEVLVNAFKQDPKLLGKCGDALSVIDIVNKTRKGEYKEAAIAAATMGGTKYLASIAPAFAAKLSLATTAVQVYTTGVSLAYTKRWVPKLEDNIYKLYKNTRNDGLLPEDGLADVQDMAGRQRGFWTVFTEAKKRVEETAREDGIELTPEEINSRALEVMRDALETRYQKELFLEAQKAANDAGISSDLENMVKGLENEAVNLTYSSQGSQPQPPQAPQPEPQDPTPEVPVEPGNSPDDLADDVESSEDTINSLPDISSDRETDVRNFIAGNVQSYLNMQDMIRKATNPGGLGGAIPSEDGGGESVRVPNLVEFRQMEAQKEIQRQQAAAAISAMAGIAAAGVSIYQAAQARRSAAASSGGSGSSGCGGKNKQQEIEAGTALWWLQH